MSERGIYSVIRKKILILFMILLSSAVLVACGAPSASTGTGTATGSSTSTGTGTFTIGGNVTGLDIGKSVTLQNNGNSLYDLTVAANGPFTFTTPLKDNSTYNVSILTQPAGQICTVASGSGTINGSNIKNVAVICSGGYNIAIGITDSSNNPTNNIMIGSPSTVTATVKDTGNPKQNAIVTFTTDNDYATLDPSSGTALTDANGNASVTISGVSMGATTITASTQINGAELQAVEAYSVGSPAITLGSLTFGVNPISAYGTTSISVEVDSNNSPVTSSIPVTFNSDCFTNGKASIDTPVNTKNGIATATYKDNGCGATDTITASALGEQSSGNLTVAAPSAGSIQFVSADPTQITLKGTGGTGLQESSIVIFKVLDTSSNPLSGKKVNFSLSTAVGGITLSQASGTTNSAGEVSVSVNSGTVSTPVRVVAMIDGTTIRTQSDQLTITTGIPDQDSASLSASVLNIEGWSHDGETTTLTMRLADHFNNPVPDGTVVNFTTEGGSIGSSCTTTNGACFVTLTSQNPRPADGRVTVLAYALGNESFIDTNGNGWADPGEFTDTSEAFVDFNENGVHNSGEPFIDFNGNGLFDTGDGCYNGILRNPATPSPCANASKYIDVNGSIVIVFSGSAADIADNSGGSINLGGCNVDKTIIARARDANGNVMPVGTTIRASTTDGILVGTTNYTVANSNARNTNTGTPTAGNPLTYVFEIKSDGTYDATATPPTCTDTTTSGKMTITVTTPKGIITTHNIQVIN